MLKNKSNLILKILLIPAVLFLLFSIRFYMGNRKFTNFTQDMFLTEIPKNTLNLHYTLADPAAAGITDYPVALGTADPKILTQEVADLENYRARLQKISKKTLTRHNRLTYDILEMYLDNQAAGKDFMLYAEPLGPTIGTQAQLPVLLAEYSFADLEDVREYLTLLSQMDEYYASILEYEKAKSSAGLFMNDQAADNIIAQCRSFIGAEENFLVPVFNEKIATIKELTDADRTALQQQHEQIIAQHVLPAYRLLIDGLGQLKGTGSNIGGLANLPDGRNYYEYLVKDSTGCYDSIPDIQNRIQQQLTADFKELQELITKNPQLLMTADPNSPAAAEPDQIMADLMKKIAADFPTPPAVNYQVKYVHESLEDHLSPAFYLTPPIDNLRENVIYINKGSNYNALELFTTLAHEGYPGHLYQTVYSGSQGPDEVRSLLNFGGYAEGWATYVEMYSYSLADTDQDTASLYRLNRSITLGISSLLDIAIHYYGFTRPQVAEYLTKIGFQNSYMADSLYAAIIEAPANYLKYYVGYLNFLDLRDAVKADVGEDFVLKDFHQKVLEIGPAPFPILEQELLPGSRE